MRSFAFLCFFIFVGCSKTTQVTGVITNAYSGKPVADLKVTLNAYNGVIHDSSIAKKVGESIVMTNEKGEFTVEYTGKGIDQIGLWLGGGYSVSHFDVEYSASPESNECTETNIIYDAIDGRLNVGLAHLSSPSDSLYFRVDCDFLGDKGTACCNIYFANKLAAGETQTIGFPVTAGRYVYVYWGTTYFKSWNAPNIDSVYCETGKTTDFIIQY